MKSGYFCQAKDLKAPTEKMSLNIHQAYSKR